MVSLWFSKYEFSRVLMLTDRRVFRREQDLRPIVVTYVAPSTHSEHDKMQYHWIVPFAKVIQGIHILYHPETQRDVAKKNMPAVILISAHITFSNLILLVEGTATVHFPLERSSRTQSPHP